MNRLVKVNESSEIDMFIQAEDGIRFYWLSRGLGDVCETQAPL